MARPRKMTTEQMLEVIDSFFFVEAKGNTKFLKCSLIADYAVKLGYSADGYDFRRNTETREYIEELKKKKFSMCTNIPIVYQSFDVEKFIRCNCSEHSMISALNEINSYWKNVSDQAVAIGNQNKKLLADTKVITDNLKLANDEIKSLKSELSSLLAKNNNLIVENRYFKKMLRTYLYPAIANEILIKEGVLEESESKVTEKAIKDLVENDIPTSFSESVTKDVSMQSKEDRLISKMWRLCDE